MSSIMDAIAAETAAMRKGPDCGVGFMVTHLPAAERKDVEAAIADPAIPFTVLSRALARAGHKISPGTIGRHRKGECSCRKS